MDTLRLVEVTGDGDLVLMTGDGRRFSLVVDEQVRSAVRRSRNGTHVPPSADRPGPREVQSRIRSGADAEQVALHTGLDVDYVRRFEGPVLAERAHVADLARATAVDRGGDPTLTLERVVLDVLTGEGHDVDDIRWDSRRSDGTRWEVLVWTGDGATRTEATWTFDTGTRSLEPVDGEAERLTGVERRRRLSAVRDTVFDVERPAATPPRGGTVDLLDALARQRGRRPTPPAVAPSPARDDEPHVDLGRPEPVADLAEPGTGSLAESGDGSGAADRAESRAGSREDAPRADDGPADVGMTARTGSSAGIRDASGPDGVAVPDEPGEPGEAGEPDLLTGLDLDPPLHERPARPGTPPPAPSPRSASSPVVAPSGVPAVAPSAQAAPGDRRARRRRAAVPSWDEIVFGAKREDG